MGAYEEGVKLYNRSEYDSALPLLEESAQNGNADAQFLCAEIYAWGHCLECNIEEDLLLDSIIEDPCVTREEYKKAEAYYKKASAQGHAEALFKLGYLYHFGYGRIRRRKRRALKLLEKAGSLGHTEAQMLCGIIYKFDMRGVIGHYKKALYWFEKAAAQGDPFAQCHCGEMYYHGEGVRKDYAMAFYRFEQSARGGSFIAQSRCAQMYEKGEGVEKDEDRARMWREAANAYARFFTFPGCYGNDGGSYDEQ